MAGRRWLLLAAMALGGTCRAGEAPAFSEAERRWIERHPVVKYAIDSYWPIEYLQAGEHQGLTRDYLQHIAAASGLRFERVATASWSDTLARLDSGEVQLGSAIAGRLLNPFNRGRLLLSDAYFAGSTLVISGSETSILFDASKLQGKRVAVRGGGGYQQYLEQHFPGAIILPTEDAGAALAAVAEGHADVAVGLDAALLPVMRRQYPGRLHIAGTLAQVPVEVAMGVSPQVPELLGIVNKSLATLTSRDSDRIEARWLADSDFGEPSWASLLHYYRGWLLGLGVLLALLLLMAQRARRAQRHAQLSEGRTTQFMAMMSHEIRTPMNAALAAVELLLRTRLDARQQELAELANGAAVNLLELLDDVLDVARLDARQLRLNPSATDMQRLGQGLADIHRPAAQAKGLTLTYDAGETQLPALWLDAVRLRQVLGNLLSNAVKFTDSGGVTLQLRWLAAPLGGPGSLSLSVSDTGIGISPAQQARLFQAFNQADSGRTRRYGGFGLGLSICKQLVGLMQGRIEVQSGEGAGTRVVVTLPASIAEPVPVLAPSVQPAIVACSPEPAPTEQRPDWVLVVDDQPVNQQAISLQLRTLGYSPECVDDGPQALARLAQGTRPGLVLLDCYLPGMDGYEVARRIRRQEQQTEQGALPIIAISAASDARHRLRCMESGMDGSLSKPLRLGALSELLDFWMPDHPSQPATPRRAVTAHLRQLFIDSAGEDLLALRQAVLANDAAATLHQVHRLHGAALVASAQELAAVLSDFEQQLRQAPHLPADISLRMERTAQAFERYRHAD
jgi:two-component system sensor histidine kinase EvgS